MSRNVFDSLKEWKQKHPTKSWVRVQRFAQEWSAAKVDHTVKNYRKVEECLEQVERDVAHVPIRASEDDWNPEIAAATPDAMALCQVVAMNENEAECTVVLDGLEVPRVSFPASVLRLKRLDVGGRFIWIMRPGSQVRSADIDPDISQTNVLTANELAELDRLYATFRQRRTEDDGEWPEYTGSGR